VREKVILKDLPALAVNLGVLVPVRVKGPPASPQVGFENL